VVPKGGQLGRSAHEVNARPRNGASCSAQPRVAPTPQPTPYTLRARCAAPRLAEGRAGCAAALAAARAGLTRRATAVCAVGRRWRCAAERQGASSSCCGTCRRARRVHTSRARKTGTSTGTPTPCASRRAARGLLRPHPAPTGPRKLPGANAPPAAAQPSGIERRQTHPGLAALGAGHGAGARAAHAALRHLCDVRHQLHPRRRAAHRRVPGRQPPHVGREFR
jgi:hypothetical protein